MWVLWIPVLVFVLTALPWSIFTKVFSTGPTPDHGLFLVTLNSLPSTNSLSPGRSQFSLTPINPKPSNSITTFLVLGQIQSLYFWF